MQIFITVLRRNPERRSITSEGAAVCWNPAKVEAAKVRFLCQTTVYSNVGDV
jgi:hypothetical protein